MIDAFACVLDALFADPNIGEDALWKAGGVGAGVAVRIIRKSPDRMAEFGDSRAVLPTVGIDIRRSQSATITEGDLILWDERPTLHFAVADYWPQRREVARVNVR